MHVRVGDDGGGRQPAVAAMLRVRQAGRIQRPLGLVGQHDVMGGAVDFAGEVGGVECSWTPQGVQAAAIACRPSSSRAMRSSASASGSFLRMRPPGTNQAPWPADCCAAPSGSAPGRRAAADRWTPAAASPPPAGNPPATAGRRPVPPRPKPPFRAHQTHRMQPPPPAGSATTSGGGLQPGRTTTTGGLQHSSPHATAARHRDAADLAPPVRRHAPGEARSASGLIPRHCGPSIRRSPCGR